jgi:hypothetical protein
MKTAGAGLRETLIKVCSGLTGEGTASAVPLAPTKHAAFSRCGSLLFALESSRGDLFQTFPKRSRSSPKFRVTHLELMGDLGEVDFMPVGVLLFIQFVTSSLSN